MRRIAKGAQAAVILSKALVLAASACLSGQSACTRTEPSREPRERGMLEVSLQS